MILGNEVLNLFSDLCKCKWVSSLAKQTSPLFMQFIGMDPEKSVLNVPAHKTLNDSVAA